MKKSAISQLEMYSAAERVPISMCRIIRHIITMWNTSNVYYLLYYRIYIDHSVVTSLRELIEGRY